MKPIVGASRARSETKPSLARVPVRMLGGALDGLVRSARAGAPQLVELARRARALWAEASGVALVVDATELRAADEVALTAGVEQGRWLLPAFMAGLRRIRPLPSASVDDLLRVAQELAALEPTASSISALQDWLWSEGAEGFELELQSSFVELVEASAADLAPKGPTSYAVRAEMLFALDGERAEVAAADLDAAALRPELEVSLDLSGAWPSNASAELSALGQECEAGGPWALAECRALRKHAPLREGYAPARLARRLAAMAGPSAGTSLLDAIAEVLRRPEPYFAEVASALERAGVGRALAQQLPLASPKVAPGVAALLEVAPAGLAQQLICELADRAAADPAGRDVLAEVLRLAGAPLVTRSLECGAPSSRAAATLAHLLLAHELRGDALTKLVGRLDARAQAAFLQSAPPAAHPACHTLVLALLRQAPTATVVGLVPLVLRGDDRAELRAMFARLDADRGVSWPSWAVTELGARAVLRELAHELVVPLVRTSRIAEPVRLALLDAMRGDAALLRESSRWRLRELLDPPEVRRRLKTTRNTHNRRERMGKDP